MKKALLVIVILLLVFGIGFYLFKKDTTPIQTNDFSSVPSDTQLLSNMHKAGLDVLTAEGTVLHIHQHLDIVVNGQNIAVPAEIGVGTGFISPIHTHDAGGVIHVESPVQKDFKLSQFFDEWGIDFNDNCVATYCRNDSHKLIVAVNGNPISSVRDYVLKAHDEIEVWYGNKSDSPALIKSYNFPEGL